MAGFARPGLPSMSAIDLLAIKAHCRDILAEKDSLSLTGKELREKIANRMGVEARLLDTAEVREHLDSVILSFVEENAEPSVSQRAPQKPEPKPEAPKPKPKVSKPKPEAPNPKPKVSKPKIEVPRPQLGEPKHVAPKRQDSREDADRADAITKASNRTTSKGKSAQEASIDRLKSYIVKCGVRKVWKRELEGLNGKQSILKLMQILRDLGVEGRPTLEKCKAIKVRREFEEELSALSPGNVIDTRLRASSGAAADSGAKQFRGSPVCSDDDDERIPTRRPRLNLAALGDPED